MYVKTLILLLLFISGLYAVDINKSSINLTPHAELFFDQNHTLTLDDLQNNLSLKFKTFKSESINLGFRHETIWMRILLSNSSNQRLRRYIVYNDPLVGEIDIYSHDTHKKYGVMHLHDQPYVKPTFPIDLQANERQTIYIKIHSDVTPMNIQLFLYDESVQDEKELIHHIIQGLFYGFLLALIIYNLAIYFSIFDRIYIYYSIYVLGILTHHIFYQGIAEIYFAPDEMTYLWSHPVALLDAFMISSMVLFSGAFLHIKRYKKLYYLFWIIALGAILNGVVMLYPPLYNFQFVLLWAFVAIIVLISSGFYMLVRKESYAKIYLLGWSPLLIMFGIVLTKQIFGINWLALFPYFEEFAMGFEAIVFSIALSLRVREINHEKNETTLRLLEYQKESHKVLEKEVENRTHSLQESIKERDVLLRELNHRVKNNMQIIISMLRLQADQCGKELQEIIAVAENRIRSMLFVHEQLYKQDSSSTINTQTYLHTLIRNLADSFSIDMKHISSNIESVELTMDQLIACGFIINELLTNAIKHNEKKENLFIEISLQLREGKIELIVRDNEPKSTQEFQENGLGLILVKSMVEEQLGGSYSNDLQNGWRTIVSFKPADQE